MHALTKSEIDGVHNKVRRWRGLSENDADDVVGDALLAYAQRLIRGENFQNPSHWLLVAAKFSFRKLVTNRLQVCRLAIDPEEPFRTDYEPASVRRVRHGLEMLNSSYRTVVELCDLEGMAPADVARSLNIPYRTVQTRLRRAHKKLEQLITSCDAA